MRGVPALAAVWALAFAALPSAAHTRSQSYSTWRRAGETVHVTGDHFREGAVVRFGDRESRDVTITSATEILARIPSSGVPEGPVDVTVVKAWGSE